MFYKAFKKDKTLSNILLNKNVARLIKKTEKNARTVVKLAMQSKIPVTALANAIGYFDAYCSSTMNELPVVQPAVIPLSSL